MLLYNTSGCFELEHPHLLDYNIRMFWYLDNELKNNKYWFNKIQEKDIIKS